MQRLMDLNKTKRAESMRKKSFQNNKIADFIPFKRSQDYPIQSLINQIIKQLIDIIETLLQQENSKNYIEYMKKTQEMLQQNQKKLINTISQKIIELRSQLLQCGNKNIQPLLDKKHNKQLSKLKVQRKIMTQNLISYHRSNSFNSFGKQLSNDGQEDILEINSLELNSINHKLQILEEQSSKNMKDIYKKLQLKIQQNFKDIRLLTQKNVEFRLKFQEKLDLSLQSLWNVIGDTQSKLCNFQQCLNNICGIR